MTCLNIIIARSIALSTKLRLLIYQFNLCDISDRQPLLVYIKYLNKLDQIDKKNLRQTRKFQPDPWGAGQSR